MYTDARTIDNNSLLEGDLCVIGAGAAGITIALEFIGTNRKIILLESGGLEYDPAAQSLNKGRNIGQAYMPLESIRLRYFGGTTGHWAGFCSTLDPIDFEERKWVPYSGWPFKKADIDQYYKRAHPVCDLGPYNYDVSYWEKQNYQAVSLPLDKTRVRTKMWQKSKPTRFGTKYRNAILIAPNIHLYTSANVTNIVLNESGKSVTGLQVKTLNGKQHHVSARNYVVACGAIQNAQLLLCSNSIMKTGVGNQNDLVGRFFMEHPHVNSADMILAGPHPMGLYYENFLTSKAFGMLALSEESQRQYGLSNYSAQLMLPEDSKLRESPTDSMPADAKIVRDFMTQFDTAKKDNEEKSPRIKNYTFSTRIEQSPNPDSRVVLSARKDAVGLNEVNLNWRLSELDKKTIKEANILIGKELGRTGIGRLRLRDWLFTEDPPWPIYLAGGCHHMGVTRMNTDPKKGVVDENCKVHGLPNLYVAGSSIFPTAGVANPTLTIVALSLRLADHLKRLS